MCFWKASCSTVTSIWLQIKGSREKNLKKTKTSKKKNASTEEKKYYGGEVLW